MWQRMPASRIHSFVRLDTRFAPYRWEFAQTHRADIEAHFAKLRATTPELWNGRMLLMREQRIAHDTLSGVYFESGFADFVAWRDWGFPDRSVVNCFALGALRASDGAYLLGVMSGRTINPGRIYFPGGVPDPSDRRGDTVDLLANVMREVAEETGLSESDFVAAPGWDAVVTGPRIALMKPIMVPRPAEDVRQSILQHLEREALPELADIRIVRSLRDLDPAMPAFITDYLQHIWARP
jgi:8-oxo-dGTP pyrophosphatase MutT (NUDIX family)